MKLHKSEVFSLSTVSLSRGDEQVLPGGRSLFPILPKALQGIRQVGFIGWGSQGPAQSQNFRDSLKAAGSNIVVKVGLQKGSKSIEKARAAGFTEEAGTLGEMYEVIGSSDLVIVLISDGAMTENYQKIFAALKPGATLGLSHGFLLGYLELVGEEFPSDVNVIMVAPKGMGRSVRLLYEQGSKVDGAGINSSVAVHQDVNGFATDYALAWSVAIGSPVTFFTTMKQEVVSDLTGERAMLLGGLWGLSEALYAHFSQSLPEKDAFLLSAKGLTSTVTKLISRHGLRGIYQSLNSDCQESFRFGYTTGYMPAHLLISRIYAQVACWDEIRDVVDSTAKLKDNPMTSIENSPMWTVGRNLYSEDVPMTHELAFAAGMYVAGVMAGINVLRENGHSMSEAGNEQLIEAVDSLTPFMDKAGVGRMVDGCSTTARLGARKWGPQFEQAFNDAINGEPVGFADELWADFMASPVHDDVAKLFKFRPPVQLIVD